MWFDLDTSFAARVGDPTAKWEAGREFTVRPFFHAFVRTLKAVHDGALPWKTIYGIDPKPGTTYPRYEHPVMIRHPDTGRAVLFVNRGFTTHLTGVSVQENRFLLEMLFNHIEASPQIQCRVQWRPNTLVMWDNVATQHHAVWDYFPQSRYAERVSSLGVELSAA